jgi:hypothetical protein
MLFAGMPAKRLEGFAEDLDQILSRLRKALEDVA